MSEVQKPTSIKFSREEAANLAARDEITTGWYRWLITEAETTVAKSGSLMIVTKQSPLEDPDDPNSKFKKLTVRNNIIIPKSNPDVDGHKAPNTAGLCHSFLMALYPEEIPDYPRFFDGALRYKGEEIEKAEEADYRQEVTDAVLEKLEYLWEHPEELIDQAFYALGQQDGDFPSIKQVRESLPDGQELVPAGQFLQKAAQPVKEKAAPAKSNGKAAPVKAAAGKKR